MKNAAKTSARKPARATPKRTVTLRVDDRMMAVLAMCAESEAQGIIESIREANYGNAARDAANVSQLIGALVQAKKLGPILR